MDHKERSAKSQINNFRPSVYSVILCLLFTLFFAAHSKADAFQITGTTTVAIFAHVGTTTSSTSTPPTTDPGGGGGGGGGGAPPQIGEQLILSGEAFRSGRVTVVQNGFTIGNYFIASDTESFAFVVPLSSSGTFTFILYAFDKGGNKSTINLGTLLVREGETLTYSQLYFAPTLLSEMSSVKSGEPYKVKGYTSASRMVSFSIDSRPYGGAVRSRADGYYEANISTIGLLRGGHTLRARTALTGTTTRESDRLDFVVGSQTLVQKGTTTTSGCGKRADFNGDCRVNLYDFSILAYWYKLKNFPKKFDLNNDGKVDIKDVSILIYNWRP